MMDLLGSLADVPYVELITPAIPAFIVLMVVEGFLLARDRDGDVLGYTVRDTSASLAMGIGSLVVPRAITSLLGLGGYFLVWRELRVVDLGAGAVAWTVAIVGKDLCYYWFHRLSHETRFLWAAHVVHHSSDHYNLSTALRQSWTPLVGWVFYLPLVLLGVNPLLLAMSTAINLLYQFWIHTEAIDRLPAPVEAVLNTPSHHRVHHAVQPQYLDTNYGGILIVWDRLFGTFEAEVERPRYGITTPLRTHNPLRIATHEYADLLRDMRGDRDWLTRLRRLVAGPGWQPADASEGAATRVVEAG